MTAYIAPPPRIPFVLRWGLRIAQRRTGTPLLPAQLLAWYPRAAVGSAVLELMADAGLHRLCARAGLPDAFVPQGPVDVLRSDLGLTAKGLAEMARRLLGRGDDAKD